MRNSAILSRLAFMAIARGVTCWPREMAGAFTSAPWFNSTSRQFQVALVGGQVKRGYAKSFCVNVRSGSQQQVRDFGLLFSISGVGDQTDVVSAALANAVRVRLDESGRPLVHPEQRCGAHRYWRTPIGQVPRQGDQSHMGSGFDGQLVPCGASAKKAGGNLEEKFDAIRIAVSQPDKFVDEILRQAVDIFPGLSASRH